MGQGSSDRGRDSSQTTPYPSSFSHSSQAASPHPYFTLADYRRMGEIVASNRQMIDSPEARLDFLDPMHSLPGPSDEPIRVSPNERIVLRSQIAAAGSQEGIRVIDPNSGSFLKSVPTMMNRNQKIVGLEGDGDSLVAVLSMSRDAANQQVRVCNIERAAVDNSFGDQLFPGRIICMEACWKSESSNPRLFLGTSQSQLGVVDAVTSEVLALTPPDGYVHTAKPLVLRAVPEWNEVFMPSGGILRQFRLQEDSITDVGHFVCGSGDLGNRGHGRIRDCVADTEAGILFVLHQPEKVASVEMWSRDQIRCVHSVDLDEIGCSVSYCRDSRLIVIGDVRGSVSKFDVRRFACPIAQYPIHDPYRRRKIRQGSDFFDVTQIDSPCCGRWISCSYDIRVWNDDGKLLTTSRHPDGYFRSFTLLDTDQESSVLATYRELHDRVEFLVSTIVTCVVNFDENLSDDGDDLERTVRMTMLASRALLDNFNEI